MYNGFMWRMRSLIGGYPGGYKKWARGTTGELGVVPFQQPTDPDDPRSRIPALGHKEYWYPALPDKDVNWKRPQVLRVLGEDLAFFRGADGQVKCQKDVCPHRGAYLSWGDNFYKGYVTCPYHGATFDGEGNCVAMLSEGPDSPMVGQMKAWPRETVTLKGIVFVWMGDGVAVDPKEDIPPELFEPNHVVRWAAHTITANWILVLENTNDAHNAFFVHRNCWGVITNPLGGRPRTTLGYRTQIVDGKSANYNAGSGVAPTEAYYIDEDGWIPYQMYYPQLEGKWPLRRVRLYWNKLWHPTTVNLRKGLIRTKRGGQGRFSQNAGLGGGRSGGTGMRGDDSWSGTRLPSIAAKGAGGTTRYRSHRWAVPVERDLTRIVYVNIERYAKAPSMFRRAYKNLTWPFRNWAHNFNFRFADIDAERSCQYQMPEYLSATDSTVVVIRKLLADYARGVDRPEEGLSSKKEQRVDELNLEVLKMGNSAHLGEIKEGLSKTGLIDKN